MLNRYSSRRQPIDAGFLNARLARARSYDRIAGYFSSSILEVAGEALESVTGPIRLVCNSGLTRDLACSTTRRGAAARDPGARMHASGRSTGRGQT